MRVLVATPVMRGELYLRSWLSWYAMDYDGQLDFFQMVGGDYADHPYDNVVRKFNEARAATLSGGYDALMTVESDTIVPKDALKRLEAADADVAYGVYVWRNGFPFWNAYVELAETYGYPINNDERAAREAWGKVIETKGVGNGCTLIRRNVLEALEFKWSPGEFGCCDWHLAVDCQRLGFVQKHDLGVVCGHIAVNPVHRILWPDPEAKGLYRSELIENWPEIKGMKNVQPIGKDHSRDLPPGEMVKVRMKKHVHMGDGLYRSPGEEVTLGKDLAAKLIKRRLAETAGGNVAGFTVKGPCKNCGKKAKRAS